MESMRDSLLTLPGSLFPHHFLDVNPAPPPWENPLNPDCASAQGHALLLVWTSPSKHFTLCKSIAIFVILTEAHLLHRNGSCLVTRTMASPMLITVFVALNTLASSIQWKWINIYGEWMYWIKVLKSTETPNRALRNDWQILKWRRWQSTPGEGILFL